MNKSRKESRKSEKVSFLFRAYYSYRDFEILTFSTEISGFYSETGSNLSKSEL